MSRIVYSVREGHFVAPVKWRYKNNQFQDEIIDIPILEKYKEIYLTSNLHPITDRKKLKEIFDKEIDHKEYCPKINHKKCPRKISQSGFFIIKNYYNEFIQILRIKNDNKEMFEGYKLKNQYMEHRLKKQEK